MKFKAIIAVALVLVLLVPLATLSAADTLPVAEDDYYSMAPDTTLNVGVPGVLGNDYDTDGDPIVVRMYNPPSSGTMLLWADGHFTYTPNAGFTGVDSFHYYISNSSSGEWLDDAYAHITVSAVVDVDIDIKPCSDPNSVNLMSKGVLPVAILTTNDFDATTVDWETVTLDGVPAIKGTIEDACIEDGDLDLVVHFSVPALAQVWDETTTEATLEGESYGGTPIEGLDTVRIVTKGPNN